MSAELESQDSDKSHSTQESRKSSWYWITPFGEQARFSELTNADVVALVDSSGKELPPVTIQLKLGLAATIESGSSIHEMRTRMVYTDGKKATLQFVNYEPVDTLDPNVWNREEESRDVDETVDLDMFTPSEPPIYKDDLTEMQIEEMLQRTPLFKQQRAVIIMYGKQTLFRGRVHTVGISQEDGMGLIECGEDSLGLANDSDISGDSSDSYITAEYRNKAGLVAMPHSWIFNGKQGAENLSQEGLRDSDVDDINRYLEKQFGKKEDNLSDKSSSIEESGQPFIVDEGDGTVTIDDSEYEDPPEAIKDTVIFDSSTAVNQDNETMFPLAPIEVPSWLLFYGWRVPSDEPGLYEDEIHAINEYVEKSFQE